MPADGLSPPGARTFADTLMTKFGCHVYTGSALERFRTWFGYHLMGGHLLNFLKNVNFSHMLLPASTAVPGNYKIVVFAMGAAAFLHYKERWSVLLMNHAFFYGLPGKAASSLRQTLKLVVSYNMQLHRIPRPSMGPQKLPYKNDRLFGIVSYTSCTHKVAPLLIPFEL